MFMRTILLLITAFLSLIASAVGYLAFTGKISLTIYVLLMTASVIFLLFLCGHLLYKCLRPDQDGR